MAIGEMQRRLSMRRRMEKGRRRLTVTAVAYGHMNPDARRSLTRRRIKAENRPREGEPCAVKVACTVWWGERGNKARRRLPVRDHEIRPKTYPDRALLLPNRWSPARPA
jgi:hypothetical protein